MTNSEHIPNGQDELIRVVFKALHGHEAPVSIEPPFHAASPLGKAVAVANAVALTRRSSAGVKGLETAIADAEAAYPGAFWVLGKGRVHGEEKLFGFYLTFGSDEVVTSGEGDDAVSAIYTAIGAKS